MASPILAFRPARVRARLPQRSEACLLSSRDLVRAAATLRLTLPVVRTPSAGVARAALVAARQAGSVLGLSLPAGQRPEPWFDAVAAAADEVAAGLPVFLAGEVAPSSAAELALDAAARDAWRLADAGITHLTVDLTRVSGPEREAALARVAQPALERGLGLDCVVTRAGAREAGALFEALAAREAGPDLASVRLEAPSDAAAARQQVRELLALCATLSGMPVLRRGPVTPALLEGLAGSPVAGCEDGGAAAQAAATALPAARAPGEPALAAEAALATAEPRLPEGALSRLEARAYGEVLDFLERLGAGGSAARVAALLEQALVDTP